MAMKFLSLQRSFMNFGRATLLLTFLGQFSSQTHQHSTLIEPTMRKKLTLVTLCLLLCNQWGTASMLQTSSSTASANRQRAIKLYQEGKSGEARDLLLDILQKDKADYLAWYYLGFALIQQEKPKDASRAFESALKLRPHFAVAHSGLGYSLLFRNRFSEAIRAAEAGLKLEPNLADANYVIGVAHLRSDDQDKALRYAE